MPRHPGRRLGGVTLSDVAREAGVSLATASRAINGSTNRSVRPELHERVMAAAAKLAYSPDANAQAMARGRTATLGLIVNDITDPYFSSVAAGVTDAAEAADLIVTLANTHHDPERELRFVRTLQNQRARAIILVSGRIDAPEANERLSAALADYRSRGGSVAMVGQPVLGVDTVQVDNSGGAADLARALHGLGYRRFGVLAGPAAHLTARDRSTGFLGALAELGVDVPGGAVVHGPFTRDGGHDAMVELLGRDVGVEAVFAVNDVMALGAMSAAHAEAVDVPGRIAIAGFDDIPTLRDVRPGLTTVRVPMADVGRLVTRIALGLDGDGRRPETVAGAAGTDHREAVPTAGAGAGRAEVAAQAITVACEVVLRESTPGPA